MTRRASVLDIQVFGLGKRGEFDSVI